MSPTPWPLSWLFSKQNGQLAWPKLRKEPDESGLILLIMTIVLSAILMYLVGLPPDLIWRTLQVVALAVAEMLRRR